MHAMKQHKERRQHLELSIICRVLDGFMLTCSITFGNCEAHYVLVYHGAEVYMDFSRTMPEGECV